MKFRPQNGLFLGDRANARSDSRVAAASISRMVPTSGFEYDELPDIELYLDANPENAQFQVWLPVRPK